MKFTSEMLMKDMKLSVGDIVKVDKYNETFELMKSTEGKWRLISKNCSIVDLIWLVDKDYEILPRPKRVGDMMRDKTLYEILHYQNEVYPDQEIYDLLKARLDKEVE